ncbi:MAG: hypothetical protein WCF23_06845 [Candidatus Nitrosopolaris sp.]
MISLLLLVGIVMPPLLPHPLTTMQYGFNGAIQDSKVVFNAIDKCQYQNNTDFVNCAHGYFMVISQYVMVHDMVVKLIHCPN